MCGPAAAAAVPWVVGAISAATSVYSVIQADQQAKDANKAAQEQYNIEADRAAREAQDRQNNLQAQVLEEGSKFQQNKQKLALDALRSRAAQRAASAESGVGGVSAVRSFIAEDVAKDLARSDLDRSAEFSTFGAQQQARGITQSRSDRIQNASLNFKSNTRRRASALDFGLAGVSGGLEGFSAGSNVVG